MEMMVLRFLHEQCYDEKAEFKCYDDDVESGHVTECRRQKAHERAGEKREEITRCADNAGSQTNLARADTILGNRVAKHIDGMETNAHESADNVEDDGCLRDDMENQECAESVEA